jgi:hypothetical protein
MHRLVHTAAFDVPDDRMRVTSVRYLETSRRIALHRAAGPRRRPDRIPGKRRLRRCHHLLPHRQFTGPGMKTWIDACQVDGQPTDVETVYQALIDEYDTGRLVTRMLKRGPTVARLTGEPVAVELVGWPTDHRRRTPRPTDRETADPAANAPPVAAVDRHRPGGPVRPARPGRVRGELKPVTRPHTVPHLTWGASMTLRDPSPQAAHTTSEPNPPWQPTVINALRHAGASASRDAADWWAQDTVGDRVTGDAAAVARRVVAGIDDNDPAILDTIPTADIDRPADLYAEHAPGGAPDWTTWATAAASRPSTPTSTASTPPSPTGSPSTVATSRELTRPTRSHRETASKKAIRRTCRTCAPSSRQGPHRRVLRRPDPDRSRGAAPGGRA